MMRSTATPPADDVEPAGPTAPDAAPSAPSAPADAPRRVTMRDRVKGGLRPGLIGALMLALVLAPIEGVRYWMPDVNGFARPLLYLAATCVVLGGYALAAPGRKDGWRVWLGLMAGGALVLLAFGVIPQRRVNAEAAQPRAWGPGLADGGVDAAMVTRWSADGLDYSLTLRCPGPDDCLAGRTVHVALRPNVRPTGVSIPGHRFARLRTGEHRADGVFPRAQDFARTDYVGTREWAVWFTPGPAGAAAVPARSPWDPPSGS